HLYSFSFEPNTQWTRPYPQQQEIQDYIVRITDKYALRPLIRFHTEVQSLRWLSELSVWEITLQGAEPVLAQQVVLATGPLNKPSVPDFVGMQSFAGPVFHSSQWRHDVALQGKRVAVVGTGASAIQFVPEIAQVAAHVDVFQRTAAWVLPRWDQPYGALRRWLYRAVPGLQRLSRWRVYWFNEWIGTGFMGSRRMQDGLRKLAMHHLRQQVRAPALQRTLTPDFAPGCKRLLISNTWFPTLLRANVQLVTQGIRGVVPQGIVGRDSTVYPCDVVIWGTGFKATEFVSPMKIFGEPQPAAGEAGSSAVVAPELGALWRSSPAVTRLGITVAGFPNLFMLVGPNTGLGHNSIIFMIECQVHYIALALQALRGSGRETLRLRPEVQRDDYARVQQQMQGTVWTSGCKSWYQNAQGQIDTLWPGYTWEYWLKTRRFALTDYV
ncbi:MAG: NAD(P)/FAD-dependent oxidoreductase, partial [Rhodoferax sp.]|nr:NAD(P)/FAD-dependent oxidoreductase [Rhodoferax sp.]